VLHNSYPFGVTIYVKPGDQWLRVATLDKLWCQSRDKMEWESKKCIQKCGGRLGGVMSRGRKDVDYKNACLGQTRCDSKEWVELAHYRAQ